MNILYVTLGALPAVAWGGPVKIAHENARELQRRGHRVTICASNLADKHNRVAPGNSEARVDGVRIVYLSTHLVSRWPGTVGPTILTPAGLRRLWTEIRDAEVVHLHGTRNALVMCAAAFARLQNKSIVLQPHGTLPHIVASIIAKRVFDSLFMRSLLDSAQVVIAGQKAELQQVLAAGGRQDRIEIVANGLRPRATPSAQEVAAFRRRLGLPEDRLLVLFLGRINAKKGADLLVEAFARLPQQTRDRAFLVIAGPDDGHLAHVRSLVRRHELSNHVLFPGLISSDDVPLAHASADVFALTCRTDTFPMALVEACRSGTPILVTETCEIADHLDGIAGESVAVDERAITSALDRLISDDQLRNRYADGGRRLIDTRFSVGEVGDRLVSIYERVYSGSTMNGRHAN